MSDAEPESGPEWGKMSRGQPYVNLATDVFRAYFAALGGLEGAILAYVIEKTWGESARKGRKGRLWPRAEPCKLDAKRLMAALGVGPTCSTNFHRAVRNLVNARMIVKCDGGFIPNKNAHEWKIAGSEGPRLKADFLDFALAAQGQKVINSDHSHKPRLVINSDHFSDPKVIKVDHSPVINSDHKIEAPVIKVDHSAHCIERTAANPTGLIQITCPTGQGAAAQPVVSSRGKKRGRKKERIGLLNLADAPIEELPIVLSPREERLHALVMSLTKTRDLEDGDPEKAAAVIREFRDWLDKGWDLLMVREAVNDAINTVGVRGVKRFKSYLAGIFKNKVKGDPEKPQAPPISQRLTEAIPNVSLDVPASKAHAAQDEAYRTSEGLWEKLPQSERSAIEADFDSANPRPAEVPAAFWRATRKRGCIDLMASRHANPGVSQ